MKKSIAITIQLLSLAALATWCIYLCPRYTNSFKYDFEVGQPWGYGLVTAEFDFPIYKTDAQLQQEYDQVLQDYTPCYTLDTTILQEGIYVVSLEEMERINGLKSAQLSVLKDRVATVELEAHKKAEALVEELRAEGYTAICYRADVADREAVKEMVYHIEKELGYVNLLVNNAGIIKDAMFHKMASEQWHQVINVNINGLYHCCKYVVPLMREQNYGKIVNLSSVSANGNAGQANYAASKAAVEGFTKALAKEGARKNITVNAIAPAHIDTPMQRSVPAEILEKSIKSNPSQRLGSVDELAAVALFLASDDSSFVNGTVIPVNGGLRT